MAVSAFNISEIGERVVKEVRDQAIARQHPASQVILNAERNILRGQRDGRRYKIPFTGGGKRGKGTYYHASRPGQPPAQRTGNLRESWRTLDSGTESGDTVTVRPGIHSNVPYNKYLDDHFGDGRARTKIKERPYVDAIRERAMPDVTRIYKRPYL